MSKKNNLVRANIGHQKTKKEKTHSRRRNEKELSKNTQLIITIFFINIYIKFLV